MRLDDFDPDINVGSQRDGGGGFGGGGGGLLLGLLPLIGSRFGCGGIAVVLVVLMVLGFNPLTLITGGTGSEPQIERRADNTGQGGGAAQICTTDPARRAACNAFSSTENTWEKLFAASGQRFQRPSLQFYSGSGQSGCGAAQSAMGPFYCPSDNGIYLDTGFFDELSTRFGAGGDFAQYYVVAHEMGHHIQTLTGTTAQVRQAQARGSQAEGNAASVKLELQADCYAGVWAAQNRDRLEPGDVEEGMTAAGAIGDDRLSGNRASPESFTHGTSAQRRDWLRRGLDSGDPAACNTFSGAP